MRWWPLHVVCNRVPSVMISNECYCTVTNVAVFGILSYPSEMRVFSYGTEFVIYIF